jgi:acetylglutamate kinase
MRPLVVKFGGELLDDPARLATVVEAVCSMAARTPLVVVHGGGKEIDAALGTAGIEKRQVDGLRITDDATLGIVVSVLAGGVNTRFVAALGAAGVDAVGLTGADARLGLATPAPLHHAVDGRAVDLGRVGEPAGESSTRLLDVLLERGFVPIVACIGVTRDGQLLNVNADTLAGHLAARLCARRLVVAGTTAGVLDETGATLTTLDRTSLQALIGNGTATAGMIAKLRACDEALLSGVEDVVIVDGREGHALVAAATSESPASGTRMTAAIPSKVER